LVIYSVMHYLSYGTYLIPINQGNATAAAIICINIQLWNPQLVKLNSIAQNDQEGIDIIIDLYFFGINSIR
jgi:hypothetical protein